MFKLVDKSPILRIYMLFNLLNSIMSFRSSKLNISFIKKCDNSKNFIDQIF